MPDMRNVPNIIGQLLLLVIRAPPVLNKVAHFGNMLPPSYFTKPEGSPRPFGFFRRCSPAITPPKP
jgi:hypothetical protein